MRCLLKLTTMLSVRQLSDLDLITDDLRCDRTRSVGRPMTSVVGASVNCAMLSGVVLTCTSVYSKPERTMQHNVYNVSHYKQTHHVPTSNYTKYLPAALARNTMQPAMSVRRFFPL